MKICVPIEARPEGGMYTFLGNLTDYFTAHGIPFTRDVNEPHDVLFVNSWVVPYEQVLRVKRANPAVRVIHRVDGSAQDYGRDGDADARQARVNLLADLTIFQSHFSKASVTERFRVIAHAGPVVYNPVGTTRFTPVGPRHEFTGGRPRVVTVAFSPNAMKGAWRLAEVAADHPEIDFVVCGPRTAPGPANVLNLGYVDHAGLPRVLRSCDLFLNLSENDPCPNVVLEALASGLPVLYIDSGGVPELVGECGFPITRDTFGPAYTAAMTSRPALGARARERAETRFAPEIIFPQYLRAIETAERQPLPGREEVLALAAEGYPVMPLATSVPTRVAAAVVRRARGTVEAMRSRVEQAVRRTRRQPAALRVGWITSDSFESSKRRFGQLDSFTRLRAGNVGEWLNARAPGLQTELYRRGEPYDIVVFQKVMDARHQDEARGIQAAGGKVIFDANVNYYEIWGDYFVPGTRPTDQQQRDAIAMTQLADWVVADSTYIAGVAMKLTPHVSWIPDCVNLDVYGGRRVHAPSCPVRLIWSGVGKKAAHLLLIRDVLAGLRDAELVLVSDTVPDCLPDLSAVIPCRVVRFSDREYARQLLAGDVIISPKRLVNGYELGHTEYKITLGMAVGLPAVASPQQSYVEAVSHAGGGIIARTTDEWSDALTRLIGSADERRDLGARARRTVAERYSTPVVAGEFRTLFEKLAGASLRERAR